MRSEYTILIFNFSKFSRETPSEEGIKMELKPLSLISQSLIVSQSHSENWIHHSFQIKKRKEIHGDPHSQEGIKKSK